MTSASHPHSGRLRKVSIACSCKNEKGNVPELYSRCKASIEKARSDLGVDFEWTFTIADNMSSDGTDQDIRKLASENHNVRAIFNSRDFGAARSSFHVLSQAGGDCAILIASDLEDPPELIPDMLRMWLAGSSVVACQSAK